VISFYKLRSWGQVLFMPW